jgi:hypothetical protein
MTKVISINGSRFALPEGMSTKDIQALAGFLVGLIPVNHEYNYDVSDYMYFPAKQGTEVRVDEVELVSYEAAKAQHQDSHARYCAKREAAKAAEQAAA